MRKKKDKSKSASTTRFIVRWKPVIEIGLDILTNMIAKVVAEWIRKAMF